MTTNELVVKMLLDRWNTLLTNCDALINSLWDAQLEAAIAPGKNRGIYLLGHLVAVHDDMLRLLDLGGQQHADLFEIFVKSPDKSVADLPATAELRATWTKQLETLQPKLAGISADAWFEKHTAVSAEDFEKEPHRNKLNILLTRTTHLAYHAGQLALLQ